MLFYLLLLFVPKSTFLKYYFRNTIRVSNSLDQDQARHVVRPDLCPSGLQKSSADDTSRRSQCGDLSSLVNIHYEYYNNRYYYEKIQTVGHLSRQECDFHTVIIKCTKLQISILRLGLAFYAIMHWKFRWTLHLLTTLCVQ